MSKKIVYIGNREVKEDNVASTGLVWNRGEIHEVADEKKAAMLIAHPDVWADADKDYKLQPLAAEVLHGHGDPSVQIVPQGGAKATPFWEPVTIPVPEEVFGRVRDKELEVVFMTAADAEAFKAWKTERDAKVTRAASARAAKAAKGLEAQAA